MKQMEVTEKRIGEHTFFIKPFPAFTAANISGELAKLIGPLIAGLASLLNGGEEEIDIRDIEANKAAVALSDAFSSLSGDQVERIMKKLLIDNENISVEGPVTDDAVKVLNFDLTNEVFCGDVMNMYALCFEVIRLNFGGFFKSLGDRSGEVQEVVRRVTHKSTVSSTPLSSASSN